MLSKSPKPAVRLSPETWKLDPNIEIIAFDEKGCWNDAPLTTLRRDGAFARLHAPIAERVVLKV